MSERLEYDLVEAQSAGHRLAITVPHTILGQLQSNDAFGADFKELTSKRIKALVVETGPVGDRLLVNDKRLGDSAPKAKSVERVLRLFTAIDEASASDQKDPTFEAKMGIAPINDSGRYGQYLKITWPQLDEAAVAATATHFMRATALKLRYAQAAIIPELVYAQLERGSFVALQTNDMGSCAFDADADVHDARTPQFDLFADKIYTPVQQFIRLVGGVAIARADQLATS